MSQKYWFRPKPFGYGFMPITWEGWLATMILIGLVVLSAYTNGIIPENAEAEPTIREALRFVFDISILISVFTALMRDKVRGGLRWMWGWNDEG